MLLQQNNIQEIFVQPQSQRTMGRGHSSDSEESRDRKKHKKEKKEKHEKKDKHNKHSHKQSDKSYRRQQTTVQRQQPVSRDLATIPKHSQDKPVAITDIYLPPKPSQMTDQKPYVPRTHIPCRRCQKETFSLKLKQCTACGYPKEQRPANFPQTKQIDVMEMIRTGKLVHNSYAPVLIEVVVNDRMGRKNRIKCSPDDKVIDLKKLVAAQIGTRAQKIRLQKSSVIYKDHLTLADYEIKDGMGLEMYYD